MYKIQKYRIFIKKFVLCYGSLNNYRSIENDKKERKNTQRENTA